MANRIAPTDTIFVCAACGKRSKDEYGDQRIDEWWDVSCMLNAVLCKEDSLVFDEAGYVIKADPVEKEEKNGR